MRKKQAALIIDCRQAPKPAKYYLLNQTNYEKKF